ncbi:alanine--tRNA ligase [bacterium]|nr:alanine--tRNA ligase [bacterium]
MTSKEIRQKYLDFFKSKGHAILPSASLIPENDSTTLFNTAGMQPLIPFLMGEKHPAGTAIANCQKCIRTGDIDCVGDTTHLTFFEMLGNWPLGQYNKEEAVKYSWEFITFEKWLNIDPNKLYITVFEGDSNIPKDTDSIEYWQKCFKLKNIEALENERIFALNKKENFWGPVGKSGICGPDTEMFIDTGLGKCSEKCQPGCSCGKYVEIWNDVFMSYYKETDGTYKKLDKPQIDTGFGLERATAILNGKNNVYETDLFIPIVDKIKKLANISNPNSEKLKSIRIVADHIRSAVMIMGDNLGIVLSNLDQGYVVRRLLRVAIRQGKSLNIPQNINLTVEIAKIVINLMKDVYPELAKNKDVVLNNLIKEETQFEKTLDKGLKELEKLIKIGRDKAHNSVAIRLSPEKKPKPSQYAINSITPKDAFKLYSTYGFPLEMINQELAKHLLYIDEKEFYEEFQKHKNLSRTASAGKFKGGLADHSKIVTKYHTATHLLHQALRQILGEHVQQKGSNLNAERLRFDFSHPEKMTEEEIKKVEDLVNQKIGAKLKILCDEKSLTEAQNEGAIGLFSNKYGNQVKVYSISDFSKEICGGPHVNNTSELGHFKIKKEQSASSGVRRIKAVLE